MGNAELLADLLEHGAAHSPEAAAAVVEATGVSREDQQRSLTVLLRHKVPLSDDLKDNELVQAAQTRLTAEAQPWNGGKAEISATLQGAERDFVADKPVYSPKKFTVNLTGGQVYKIGRADPEDPSHEVHVDLSEITSAPSVSRRHVEVRHHDSLQTWQVHVVGRNGIYDSASKFFPPSDEWIDLDVFPDKKFEVCWVIFQFE